MLGDLQHRHVGDADGRGGSRLYFYRLDRRVHGDGRLRRDNGRSQIRERCVHYPAAYGALGSFGLVTPRGIEFAMSGRVRVT